MDGERKVESRTQIEEGHLWNLALSYLKRADDSANYLRALLFTLCAAAIAYLTTELKDELIYGFVIALVSFAAAIALIVISWDIQKLKAGRRFEALRDFGFSKYQEVNREIQNSTFQKNYVIDRFAYGLIAIGFVAALATKAFLVGKF